MSKGGRVLRSGIKTQEMEKKKASWGGGAKQDSPRNVWVLLKGSSWRDGKGGGKRGIWGG